MGMLERSDEASNNFDVGKKRLFANTVKKSTIIFSRDEPHSFIINNKNYTWLTSYEKIDIIRNGLPYSAIEAISRRTNIPVKHYLASLGIVQTTYNKKKKRNEHLSRQNSELIIELIEFYNFGLIVFNNEIKKFQRWLRKPNVSLGGVTPESMFDSFTGIREIKKALNRIEYGNMV